LRFFAPEIVDYILGEFSLGSGSRSIFCPRFRLW